MDLKAAIPAPWNAAWADPDVRRPVVATVEVRTAIG
jgi:hypothetical protein